MSSQEQTVNCARIISAATDDATALAFFSAMIAFADNHLMKETIVALRARGINPAHQYEVILQSYLFCGFPRMLEALFNFNELNPASSYLSGTPISASQLKYSAQEVETFERNGQKLIRQIYAENHERLENAVVAMSPDAYRWMVMEGYGKTLSRPDLDVVTRELAVIGALTVDGRARQLRSHLRGALNVGTTRVLIEETFSCIEPLCDSEFHALARRMFSELGEE